MLQSGSSTSNDVTDLPVAGMDAVPGDSFDAAKMRIAVASLSSCNILRDASTMGKATAS